MVQIDASLVNHMLSVSMAEKADLSVATTNSAGFVCVTKVQYPIQYTYSNP